jgi:hypothetical protein
MMSPSAVKIPVLALLVLALGLGVAACGDGGDETETVALPKAQYIAKADAICDKTEKRQEAALKAYEKQNKGTSFEDPKVQEALIREAAVPPLNQQVEELRALGVPEVEAGKAEEVVDGIEEATREAEDNPIVMLESTETPFSPVEKKARAFGFKTCGSA